VQGAQTVRSASGEPGHRLQQARRSLQALLPALLKLARSAFARTCRCDISKPTELESNQSVVGDRRPCALYPAFHDVDQGAIGLF
jgi:hypothetical protein